MSKILLDTLNLSDLANISIARTNLGVYSNAEVYTKPEVEALIVGSVSGVTTVDGLTGAVDLTGNYLDILGSAVSAAKITTPVSIILGGGVTGSASTDMASDVTITTTVVAVEWSAVLNTPTSIDGYGVVDMSSAPIVGGNF